MLENQLSRYGSISKAVPYLQPGAKLFLVSDSDDTTVGPSNLGNEFPVDKDGVARVYTTIQAAVNAASAGRGDVVLVLPSYDHTLGRTDSWATAAVKIIGLGSGLNRPTIRYTTATDEVGVAANNVHIENLRFLSAVDSCARALDFDTGFSGATLKNCLFDFNANGNDFRVMVRMGQARSTIEGNEFRAEDTLGCGRGVDIWGGYPDFLTIKNNFFYGQFDSNGDSSTGGGAIATDSQHDSGDTNLSGLNISNNTIVSTDTAAALLFNISSAMGISVRGIAANNLFASYDTATADTAMVGFGVTGGLLPLANKMITGDSDIRESVVGRTVARIFDSG